MWLSTSVTETIGSAFSRSGSVSSMMLLIPDALAAFLCRRRLGMLQMNAVMTKMARRPAMPPAAMTAMMGVDRPPADVVIVVDGER